MMKTYIAALLVVLLAGAQVVQAQESMDDVLAQLDSANGTTAPEAAVETAPAGTVDVAPAAVETSADVVAPAAASSKSEKGATLFDRGRAYYDAGDYAEAEAVFDAMLAIDPYDKRAMTYLDRTARRVRSLEEKKRVPTRAEAMKEVEEKWSQPPVVRIDVTPPKPDVSTDPVAIAIEKMTARVKSTIIPFLDFRDEATVKDAVLFLIEDCRKQDPAGKGINMILLGMDSFDEVENNVMINTRDISLYDALEYITEMAKLKFEIRPNVVAIMPVNYAPASAFVLKSYDVSPDVGAELEAGAGSADEGGGADDLFGDSFSAEPAAGPADVAGFFSIVDFPEGAEAIYQPRFLKLFVKNTPKNLEALEQVLADMEDEATRKRAQQVEIEAKFVEFNEGALEEIGFDWNVYGSGSVGGFTMQDGTYFKKADGFLTRPEANDIDPFIPGVEPYGDDFYTDPISGYTEITPDGNRVGQSLFSGAQRTSGAAFEALQSGILSTMGGSPAAMVFGNGDVDLRISAMEQEGTADVLSAPKVTTKSGNEAIIRVVEVHRYPQDYDVETGQRTAPVVKPQDWEDFDLGVSLKVTPVVDSDSNTIDLDLQPEITKFKGFDNYVVGYNAYDTGGNNAVEDGGDGSALLARMPFFEKRSIQTQVTIADGNTVLMGGLVDERTETFRDQVPFLGDIPYIGRLFRTEGSRSQKKNLVIYVKATQVDDHGMTQADRDIIRVTNTNI